ncbi:chitinase-like protein PB1E7.04c, partial [Biomphalaria glabrata]
PDTCGDHFFLPTFPECDVYLEAIRCHNNSPVVIITLTTPSGENVHSFEPTIGDGVDLNLYTINKNKYP